MQSLDERLAELRFELKEHQDRAQDEAERAERIRERIAGIEEARAALQPQAGNGAAAPRVRKKRRNIQALVKEFLARPRTFSLPSDPEELTLFVATQIDCRPKQVRALVKAWPAEINRREDLG